MSCPYQLRQSMELYMWWRQSVWIANGCADMLHLHSVIWFVADRSWFTKSCLCVDVLQAQLCMKGSSAVAAPCCISTQLQLHVIRHAAIRHACGFETLRSLGHKSKSCGFEAPYSRPCSVPALTAVAKSHRMVYKLVNHSAHCHT